MSNLHDLKARELQAEVLNNRIATYINLLVSLRLDNEDIDISHPLSLVTKQYVDNQTNSGVPILARWQENEIVPKDFFRTYVIDGIEMLFRSKIDDNSSIPTIAPSQGIVAWTNKGPVTYAAWENGITYALGDWIFVNTSYGTRFYTSIQNGNTGHDPSFEPDEGGTWWNFEGTLIDSFVPGLYYTKKDIVVDGGVLYISAIYNNKYDLQDLAPPWTEGADLEGTEIPNWNSLNVYAMGEIITRSFSDGTNIYDYVYESLQNGNENKEPLTQRAFWRFVGSNEGVWDSETVYAIGDVTVQENEGLTTAYYSNKDGNISPVNTSVTEGDWEPIGAIGNAPASETLPFDWALAPLTTIEWTDDRRNKFGEHPKVEIWKNDPDNEDFTETLVLPGYGVSKTKSGGLVTQINIDVDFSFDDVKTGYYLITR